MHLLLRSLPKRAFFQSFRSRPGRPGAIQRNLFTSTPSRRVNTSVPFQPRPNRPTIAHRLQFRRFNSSKQGSGPVSEPGQATPTLSITQRLRKLSREYGYSAVGVYIFLSALDFPFCFLAVRTLGTDRIAYWEHQAIAWFWKIVPWPFPTAEKTVGDGVLGDTEAKGAGWGVEDAEKANRSAEASM